MIADLDRLAAVLARQGPAWPPGTRQAYHAISLGFYEGELLRRVDPQQRSLGQFFQDEIASPLDADAYIRLPEEIPNSRLATLQKVRTTEVIFGLPFRLLLTSMLRVPPSSARSSSPTRDLGCRSMTSGSMPATSRCRPEAASAALGGSYAPTTPSPSEGMNSDYVPRPFAS